MDQVQKKLGVPLSFVDALSSQYLVKYLIMIC